ncbi:sigma 54 modulation/S30EA ribosomal C-terminal domain-containing protein [Nocardia brasiliensis]|uniref:sigma 54 modulation/S30EA ribosomal C-terminal domain-containing protein n=1 Tax=Nocardia brasiliensis TaxID=37326 RepID=UPI0018954CAE|nr:sigma 54 modulation/S30EA ribosomal C-terminal domain-containing protein [Nocardia brasiliensis]MBF6128660.1 sigma 54 modulation/S30EA ribosomal C-terminal domain-containing protein [Nocardia brasiliensis]
MTVSELGYAGPGTTPLLVTTCGAVTEGQLAQARRTIGWVLRRHRAEDVARVRIGVGPNPDGPLVIQVNLDFGESPVRAQAIGPGGFAAMFVAERLDRILDGVRAGALRPRWPDPRRPLLARSTALAPVVRRKRCALSRATVTEATTVLATMDYDAHLFVDVETGMDAVVYRAGPRGVRLARQHRLGLPAGAAPSTLTVNPYPTLHLSEQEAAERLCRYGLPFLFSTDPASGRGRLLYRRYDGDLTSVTSSEIER